MVQENKVLAKLLNEIANENGIKNPKITISDAIRGGYLGDPNRILIEETENGRSNNTKLLHLFLKAAPKGEASRKLVPLRQIYHTEIYVYTEVLPTFLNFQEGKGVKEPFRSYAKCFKCSREENNEFLIFEDLAKGDYVLWDKSRPMSPKNVEFVFKETARFHAVSFAFQDQRPEVFKEFSKTLDPEIVLNCVNRPFLVSARRLNSQEALRCFDPVSDARIYNKLKHFVEEELETAINQLANSDEVVVIHGDSWCNNFLFKFGNDEDADVVKEMKFLDWQVSRTASPAVDLCYFLYFNGPQEALDNLDYYQKVYHDTLSSALREMGTDVEQIFPLSSFKNHWKKYARVGLGMACGVLNLCYHPDQTETPDVYTMLDDGKDVVTALTTNSLQHNEDYRKRMRGLVTHCINNGFI